MNEGDLKKAVAHLEKALALTRQLGDRAREVDALNNLGYALLAMGQARDGAASARPGAPDWPARWATPTPRSSSSSGWGWPMRNLRDPAGALALLNKALEMTRAVGDRQQETQAPLEPGHRLRRPEPARRGHRPRRGIDRSLAQAGQAGGLVVRRPAPAVPHGLLGPGLETGRGDRAERDRRTDGRQLSTATQTANRSSHRPGLLRMAVSATKAMMKFIGSGLKTSAPDIQQKRMATCQACEHHTGLRCRICGCFTNVKTRMAHEQCPIGKWPA